MTPIEELQSLLNRLDALQADIVSYANREVRPLMRHTMHSTAMDLRAIREHIITVHHTT